MRLGGRRRVSRLEVAACALLPLLVGATGCADGEAGGDASDGARIEEAQSAAGMEGAALPALEAGPPVARVGHSEEGVTFSNITSALLLPDGSFVVADGGGNLLRSFSASGAFLDALATPGSGPGEAARITDIADWPGDSIAVLDADLRRLSVLPLNGDAARTVDLREGEPGLWGEAVFLSRERIAVTGRAQIVPGSLPEGRTDVAVPLFVRRIGPAPPYATKIGEVVAREILVVPGGGFMFPLLAPNGSMAGTADAVFIADGSSPGVRTRASAGGWSTIDLPVSFSRTIAADQRDVVEAGLLDETGNATSARRILDAAGLPDRVEGPGRIVDTGQGLIWIERRRIPGLDDLGYWIALTAEGEPGEGLELPADAGILSGVGTERLLLKREGALEVESVEVVPLGPATSGAGGGKGGAGPS